MANGTVTLTVSGLGAQPVSPSRVNSPPSIRGQAGMKLFGGSLANSLAGDLESLSLSINAIYKLLRTPQEATGQTDSMDGMVAPSALNQITVSTTPYTIPADADVITFATGASVATLPDATTIRRRPIWLINQSGTTITVNPGAGDTLGGASLLSLTPGSRYQVMPNA